MGPPPVVEHLNIAHDSRSSGLVGLETVVVVELIFQGGEERLRDGVVPALTGHSHGLADPVAPAPGAEGLGGVLRSVVGVENSAVLKIPVVTGHRHRIDDQRGLHMCRHGPADDHPGVEIDDRRQV